MYTDIIEIPTDQLREAFGAILKHREMNGHSNESIVSTVDVGELTLTSKQIYLELNSRRACRDKQYRNFQWDVHHLAEDCIATLGPEDGEAIDEITKGIAEFRTKFNIRSCPSCRQ